MFTRYACKLCQRVSPSDISTSVVCLCYASQEFYASFKKFPDRQVFAAKFCSMKFSVIVLLVCAVMSLVVVFIVVIRVRVRMAPSGVSLKRACLPLWPMVL